ncbi:MAG: hypothetical protein ACOVKC_10205, partial [Brevundimonas sp.]
MGDRTDVRIEIGGKLPRALIPELVKAAESDGVSIDYGDEALTEAYVQDGDGPLILSGYEINYADLPTLQDFCRTHKLPYRKEWGAGDGYPAGGELMDAEGLATYGMTESGGDPALDAATIIKLGSYEAVMAVINRLIEPVPDLEII